MGSAPRQLGRLPRVHGQGRRGARRPRAQDRAAGSAPHRPPRCRCRSEPRARARGGPRPAPVPAVLGAAPGDRAAGRRAKPG